MNKIEEVFKKLKEEGKKAFIPYIMAGDPCLEKTEEVLKLLQNCGADICELGVPFTDPLADGPIIQAASDRALKKGITLEIVLERVKKIKDTIYIPIVLMTYFNPVFKFGIKKFIYEAKNSGIDGVIIPDLPPDEAKDIIDIARKVSLATIFLIAPTSTDERIKLISSCSTGFIYYVSLTGITGANLNLTKQLKDMIKKVRSFTEKPIAVGFGVKTPQQAKVVAEIADGVIIGSEIVKRIQQGSEGLKEYLLYLRRAIS